MRTTIETLLCTCSIALMLSGCATSFTGEAHIEGPKACIAKCHDWGMELSGMVAMGEYSDACICRVKGKTEARDEVGAAGAGAVGVVLQMRAAQQQQQPGMMPGIR